MANEQTPTPTAAPATPDIPVPSYDAMSAVFDELMTPAPATTEEEESAPAPVDAAADAVKEETPAAEAPPVETPPVDASATTPAAAPPEVPPAEDDWKARYEALQAERQPAPAAPVAETTAAPAPKLYTPAEEESLTAYQRDWSEVMKGESLIRRAEYQQLVAHIFSEITREYGPLIERGAAAADTVSESASLATIWATHDDYDDTMYDNVKKWADGLTGYRKAYAQGVIAEGDPSDVVDLISEYKSASGLNKPKVVADGGSTPTPTPVVTEISAAAKKAAKALGVVDSKRSVAAPVVADPTDFDSAWTEAISTK